MDIYHSADSLGRLIHRGLLVGIGDDAPVENLACLLRGWRIGRFRGSFNRCACVVIAAFFSFEIMMISSLIFSLTKYQALVGVSKALSTGAFSYRSSLS